MDKYIYINNIQEIFQSIFSLSYYKLIYYPYIIPDFIL